VHDLSYFPSTCPFPPYTSPLSKDTLGWLSPLFFSWFTSMGPPLELSFFRRFFLSTFFRPRSSSRTPLFYPPFSHLSSLPILLFFFFCFASVISLPFFIDSASFSLRRFFPFVFFSPSPFDSLFQMNSSWIFPYCVGYLLPPLYPAPFLVRRCYRSFLLSPPPPSQ